MSDIFALMAEHLYQGQAGEVTRLVTLALAEGLKPSDILKRGLMAGMERVGCDFRDGNIYVPEVLIAARAMHAGMGVLRPFLVSSDTTTRGRVILGTVRGDLHDIGKNLVGMLLESAGFEVIDLGIDIPPEKFVAAVREKRPSILGLSALLTTTLPEMKSTIRALIEAGARDGLKIMVGGAPVTQEFADSIGADGYAPDAASATDKARELLKVVRQ